MEDSFITEWQRHGQWVVGKIDGTDGRMAAFRIAEVERLEDSEDALCTVFLRSGTRFDIDSDVLDLIDKLRDKYEGADRLEDG